MAGMGSWGLRGIRRGLAAGRVPANVRRGATSGLGGARGHRLNQRQMVNNYARSVRASRRAGRATGAAPNRLPVLAPQGNRLPVLANPPRNPSMAARYGKYVAGAVAAGTAFHIGTSGSGRGVDRVQGRPTGMYGY